MNEGVNSKKNTENELNKKQKDNLVFSKKLTERLKKVDKSSVFLWNNSWELLGVKARAIGNESNNLKNYLLNLIKIINKDFVQTTT